MVRPARILAVILAFGAWGGVAQATPQQTIAKLRVQIASSKKTMAKQTKQIGTLTVQRDNFNGQWLTAQANLATTQTALASMTADRNTQAANLAIANGTIGALQAQVAQQAQGGASAVIAGGPNAMWAAIQAIWQAFPLMPSSSFCGFDKDTSTLGGTGLNIAHFTFSNYTNC